MSFITLIFFCVVSLTNDIIQHRSIENPRQHVPSSISLRNLIICSGSFHLFLSSVLFAYKVQYYKAEIARYLFGALSFRLQTSPCRNRNRLQTCQMCSETENVRNLLSSVASLANIIASQHKKIKKNITCYYDMHSRPHVDISRSKV